MFRLELRSLVEYFLLPGLAAVLPWPLAFRLLRLAVRHPALYVREWEPVWRPMLPVDEIFETVVDSGFVGVRKPEARIYEMTLERLGLPAEACLFVDDLDPNIEGARRAGTVAEQTMSAVRERIGLLAPAG